jgi:hypothetical protein
VLHKCANPLCLNPFRKLSEGKLFLVETEALDPSNPERSTWKGKAPRHIEHYWLCDQCASVLTLSFERGRGMITVPLPRAARKIPVASVRLGEVPGEVGARTEQSASKGA